MITEIIENSLDYDKFFNKFNSLKIIDLFSNEYNLIGGDENHSNSSFYHIILIIGIIIIIIGIYLCCEKNDYTSTDGIVSNITFDDTNVISLCKFNITYNVDNIQYSKIITVDKLSEPTKNIIKIYYKISDPNVMVLYDFNYIIIGLILVFIGLFLIIASVYNYGFINLNETIKTTTVNEPSFYVEKKNIDGIIYKKIKN
jgi:uncharacterized membrane protein